MQLERFDPAADAAVARACHDIELAAQAADDPCGPAISLRCFAGWLQLGWTGDPAETWVARDDGGEPCGWYRLSLPERENQHVAHLDLVIHPARRRAGLGRALARHAAGRARQAGRTLLAGMTREGTPGGAFARAAGARQAMTDVRRILMMNEIPPGRLTSLRARAEAAAAGYSLLSWTGPAPAELVSGLATVYAGTADIPREPGQDAQHWDEERVRLDERRSEVQGLRRYTVAARSRASGELAGLTQLSIDPPLASWGFQELTVVARPHRGHRLGLLVKVAMLQLLASREPQLTRIITGNADSNKHMIAINDELGYTVLDRSLSWEAETGTVLAVAAVAAAAGTSRDHRGRTAGPGGSGVASLL